jgi:LEA14-like dessication related protein
VRIENSTTQPVTINKIGLEVNFADELAAPKPTQPSSDTEAAADSEPVAGSGGDDTYEVDVFEGQAKVGEIVAAGLSLDVPVKVSLSYPEKAERYIRFCQLEVAHVDVEGVVQSSRGEHRFKDTGEIPPPSLPEPTAEQVQVASANAGEAGDLSMVLRIFNANVFPFKIRDWSYKIYVGDKLMREATVGVGERIQPNTAIQYDVVVQLNEQTYGNNVRALLTGQSIGYRIEGALRFRDVTIPTNISSEVSFSR